MTNEVFLDTAYAIALSAPGDAFHQRALDLADQLSASRVHLITTRAVLLEIGNSLSRQRYRQAAITLLTSLEADPQVEILPLTEELYVQAARLFRERPDKDWGLTDCISFVVMQGRGVITALTTDEHFTQAGFRALLRET